MSFTVTGIAFSAMPTNNLHITNNKNVIEEVSKIEDEQYSYKTNSTEGTLVEFRDPTNGKNVSVSLNDNVLDRLKSHFSGEDFSKGDNGNLKLSGDTEKFVSGWFGDIAYKREFLNADQNQDGKLDSDEYLKTRNDFYIAGAFYDKTTIEEKVISNYSKVTEKESLNYIKKLSDHVKNLDEELNRTIKSDKNFDSEMSLDEAYSAIGSTNRVLITHAKELGLFENSQNNQSLFKVLSEKIIDLSSDNKSDEELKKLQALMKLLMANGDASKLSADERELLGSEVQKYAKDITAALSSSLSTVLDEKITTEIDTKIQILQTEDKKLEALEKLKQNSGDVSQISKEEKELITFELEKITNKDGSIDTTKLDDIINYSKTSKIYNEPEFSQMVGKYYEKKG